MKIKKQKGANMVEFAIVALVFFMVIFGAIEFARAWSVYNTLTEATRRGARVAVVCPTSLAIGKRRIDNAVLFNGLTSNSLTGLMGLTRLNVKVTYLEETATPGVLVGVNPLPLNNADPAYDDIDFVRVEIIGYTHNLIIPLLSTDDFATPSFSTTLPRESLGRLTLDNPVANRNC